MLEGDSEEAAILSAATFSGDSRFEQFYDPNQLVGKSVAQSLGVEEDVVAWDIYLFYGIGELWTESPPIPVEWMHQLVNSEWADPAHLYRGEDLINRLRDVTLRLLSE